MTPEALTELNRKIAVMQAYRDGKEVEYAAPMGRKDDYHWVPISNPNFNWEKNNYRVKADEPQRLVGLRYRGETVHSAWCNVHRAGVEFSGAPETAEKVEFIELTPSVRAKLNL